MDLSEEDFIESDNLMPNERGSGIFVTEQDPEVIQEIQAEKAMVSGAAPLFTEIFGWFDQEIEWAKSIEGVVVDGKVPADVQVLAKQRLLEHLEGCKDHLQLLYNEHIK